MRVPRPVPARRLRSALGGLFASATLLGACHSVAGPPVSTISEIALERDCFGCDKGTRLVLRRDGTALLETSGKARFGTQDATSTGRVSLDDFEALAERIVELGFFNLDDVYQDPKLADGAWTTTSVVRDGKKKSVQNRNDMAPDAVAALERSIDQLGEAIRWAPVAK